MPSYFTSRRYHLPLAALALSVLCFVTPAWAQRAAVKPVRPGELFPAGNFKVFNPQVGTTSIDLAQVLGRKPVVLCYWIPGNERAETILGSLLTLAREIGSDQVAVYAVAVPNPGIGVTPDVVHERITALGVDVPVLNDDGFTIGQQINVRSVPNISIIDKGGRLQLTNGASLQQVLEYKVDLAAAVRRVATSGELYTYGYLPPYYPVKELEGQPSPDFKAPLLTDSVEQRWHSLIDEDKINVLIFWSVDCPHCREHLPEVNAWIEKNTDIVNVFGCATVTNDAAKIKTLEFCELSKFSFPNLVDKDAQISHLYGVTTTPTIVIIGPDGVVDSAITSAITDFGATIERKKTELLSPSGS